MADKYEDEILEGEVSDDDDQEENKKEPEKYCTLCHRAESQVGKMIDLPNNIHICPDCMQRSFDSMNPESDGTAEETQKEKSRKERTSPGSQEDSGTA